MRMIPVTDREINRKKYLDRYLCGKLTKSGLAAILKLCIRQIDRILNRYEKYGLKGILHRNRGKPSGNRMECKTQRKINKLLKTRYEGFGATFAAEKLREEAGISVSPTQIRRMQKQLGLWQPKRKGRKHRYWREPKKHFGEMAQFDGSEHKWFYWSGEYYTLLKFVDDATKEILWAEFATSESYKSVMTATINYFRTHGKPVSIYVDCGKAFRVNLNNPYGERITQYQRALNECSVKLIHAYSPQAKGRIERSFGTDQDRLVKEMKLAGIQSLDAANEFLKTYYIPKYNRLFSRKAALSDNLHTSIEGFVLDDIFCIKNQRKLQNDLTISYKTKLIQIYKNASVRLYPNDSVLVFEHLDGTISVWGKCKKLVFKEVSVDSVNVTEHDNNPTNQTEEPPCKGEILYSISGTPIGSTFVCNLGHFHWRQNKTF